MYLQCKKLLISIFLRNKSSTLCPCHMLLVASHEDLSHFLSFLNKDVKLELFATHLVSHFPGSVTSVTDPRIRIRSKTLRSGKHSKNSTKKAEVASSDKLNLFFIKCFLFRLILRTFRIYVRCTVSTVWIHTTLIHVQKQYNQIYPARVKVNECYIQCYGFGSVGSIYFWASRIRIH